MCFLQEGDVTGITDCGLNGGTPALAAGVCTSGPWSAVNHPATAYSQPVGQSTSGPVNKPASEAAVNKERSRVTRSVNPAFLTTWPASLLVVVTGWLLNVPATW